MRKTVKIADKTVGDNHPCFITAEIGINHNGSVALAKKLIDIACVAGCDAVKFQKRTVDVVYSKEELERPRQSIFGETNGDLKRGLEFGFEQYREIDLYCKEKGILWYASCWDEASVDFIEKFDVPCFKIAAASLTDDNLLKYTKSKGKPIFLSTGMSSMEQIRHAVDILGDDNLIIYQCTSTYPTDEKEINLKVIETLKKEFNCPIGYSGHERGLLPTIVAAVYGASAVERHITNDRTNWGSDQAASLELDGIHRIVRDIRKIPNITGDGIKKVYDSELPIINKLRRVK
ncbi:N-acetylneuraminate synthase family protein [bacterium]|nr:N-acetylneuraminate synthase family protein [bacterium]